MNNDSFVNPYQPRPAAPVQPVMPPSMQGQPAPTGFQPAYGYPQPSQPIQPTQPGQPIQNQPKPKGTNGILTALTVLFGIGTVVFIVLFIWMAVEYGAISSDVDKRISDATIKAVDENTAKLEADFAEREKSPYKTFAGPVDYGEVTFNCPRTWSVYEYASAYTGGDYGAVFNPDKITSAEKDAINALRMTITSRSYDEVVKDYDGLIQDGKVTMDVIQVNGANVNLYRGEIVENLYSAAVIIKIRDKTVTVQTDAYSVFENDFFNVLNSLKYNA